VDKPHPTPEQDYRFERPLKEARSDGSAGERRIDCYRRSRFILEARKIKAAGHTKGYDDTGLTPALAERIRALAEQLDAHRKTLQAAHPDLTLTGLYNVLDQLRSGEALSTKNKTVHEQGLVSVLRTLHDELDVAVQAAYGWSDLGPVPCANKSKPWPTSWPPPQPRSTWRRLPPASKTKAAGANACP
jgi:hypothetical protein